MGWQIVVAAQLQAGNTIINANGSFTYSSAPAANNLVASQAPAGGVDQFGNHYLAGIASYGASTANALTAGALTLYSGSLGAGWSSSVSIELFSVGIVVITGGLETSNNTLDDGLGNMSVSDALSVTNNASVGSLVVGGSSSTGEAATDATISTTSGNFNGGTLTSHNHSHGHTHAF